MALDQRKYSTAHTDILRDNRSIWIRIGDVLATPATGMALFLTIGVIVHFVPLFINWIDLFVVVGGLYLWWLATRDRTIIFKMPYGSKYKDGNNTGPGKNMRPEGIMYLGNHKETNEEVWFTKSDASTHILYLGTTGAGKTEGLKSIVSNALTWGSGFVYIDGKADTDLWSGLSSLVRRFGRDDDLMILNYMTGNSDTKAPSNSMNPFSSGSASYLTNMLVSLMPDAEGDNAMWKERAVALVGTIMPALTWKRDNQDTPLNVTTIREFLQLNNIIKLSREEALPPHLAAGVKGYLETLPGYNDSAWDDEGKEKPASPGQPPIDQTTAHQQHGYLSMQFTRSLQSLGDEYGYIFDAEYADVNMVDIVLNRRIMVVLIPALEKSSDEIANLGKIVAATIKGMMGSSLGSSVEGSSETVIENKPTHSATPFVTVFDEVGYYTAAGMAVMAAQARSLGFSLVFSAQDLPALEKRVKEEARSITANCNIKIFGKLEDPTQTKEFFEKTVGDSFVTETSGLQTTAGSFSKTYMDTHQASIQLRANASYDGLKAFSEGQAVICFGDTVMDAQIYYSNPGHAKAMRVTRFMALPPHSNDLLKQAGAVAKLRDRMVKKNWTATKAAVAADVPDIIANLAKAYKKHEKTTDGYIDRSICSVVEVYGADNPIDMSAPVAPQQPAQQPAQTATQAPEQPAQQTPQQTSATNTEESAGEKAAAPSGGPMGFFKKGDSAKASEDTPKTEASAPAPAQEEKSAPEAQAVEKSKADPQALDILKKAGESASKSLLSKKEKQDDA
ncbi:MAG: type IV secretory system conjugative DNA transfer family protein [Bdellovibrionales bacterium]